MVYFEESNFPKMEKIVAERIAELENRLDGIRSQDLNVEGEDEISVADAAMTRDRNGMIAKSASAELIALRKVDSRIKNRDPEYGHCSDCGEPISLKRLMAVPSSLLCIDCATATAP